MLYLNFFRFFFHSDHVHIVTGRSALGFLLPVHKQITGQWLWWELNLISCLPLHCWSDGAGMGSATAEWFFRLRTEQGEQVRDPSLAPQPWCCPWLPSHLLLQLHLILQHCGTNVWVWTSLSLSEEKKLIENYHFGHRQQKVLAQWQIFHLCFPVCLGPPLNDQPQRGNQQFKSLKQAKNQWSPEFCGWCRKTKSKGTVPVNAGCAGPRACLDF